MSGPRTAALLALLLSSACGSAPIAIPEDPTEALDLVETLLDREDAETADDVLDDLDRDLYVDDELARLDALRMRALYATGKYWKAYQVARDFVEQHRFSPRAETIEELEFLCGKALLDAKDSSGEVVLQHFTVRFEASPYAAEALKLLGEFAFQQENYPMAHERFAELLQRHKGSEWAKFAKFRLAITAFRRVRGPEYDLAQMTLARNELADYLGLEPRPERPEFIREAEQSLATLESWIARRHVIIADFYRRIGNLPGERSHLRNAASGFPATAAGAEAQRRLTSLAAAVEGR